jgi:hypothetical protein
LPGPAGKEIPRQANSLGSSRVMGPVVSRERSEDMRGSQYVPARTPSKGWTSTASPMFSMLTSHSMDSARESSMVLKKIGAILPPIQTPPLRSFGM